jgi:hypothetical protein
MCRAHDPLVEDGHVLEQVIRVDVLLIVRPDEVVVGHAGDGEDGHTVQLGVIEAIEQVDRPRSGRRHADAQATAELRVAHGCERCGFLVTHVHEADPVPGLAERLQEAVDAVAGQAEDRVHSPVE